MGTSMGTPDLGTIQQWIATAFPKGTTPMPPGLERAPGLTRAPGLQRQGANPSPADAGQIAGQFEAAVYTSQVQQVSLAAQMQEARARVAAMQGEDGATQASVDARQLTFDFFAESRVEELAVFRARTAEVTQGLSGQQRATYIEASRQVSARFSMSMTLSGAALNGFAGASENIDPGSTGFDALLALAGDALNKADEILNKMFALLDDFTKSGLELQDRIDAFLAQLAELGLFGGTGGGSPLFPASGGTQFTAVGIQLEFKFEFSATVSVQQGMVQEADPIVLDLNGNGIQLTSYRDGARFDIQGSGRAVNTAFVTGGDAFLAIDRNGNGVIDSGRELFGDQNGAANGFEELRKLDTNGDGRINALDRDFDKLLLWRDNGNGITEPGELMTLRDMGIAEISLGYRNVNQVAAGGNRIAQVASFVWDDGRRGLAADAILNFVV